MLYTFRFSTWNSWSNACKLKALQMHWMNQVPRSRSLIETYSGTVDLRMKKSENSDSVRACFGTEPSKWVRFKFCKGRTTRLWFEPRHALTRNSFGLPLNIGKFLLLNLCRISANKSMAVDLSSLPGGSDILIQSRSKPWLFIDTIHESTFFSLNFLMKFANIPDSLSSSCLNKNYYTTMKQLTIL